MFINLKSSSKKILFLLDSSASVSDHFHEMKTLLKTLSEVTHESDWSMRTFSRSNRKYWRPVDIMALENDFSVTNIHHAVDVILEEDFDSDSVDQAIG